MRVLSPPTIVALALGGAAGLAVFDLPYWYYQLLRWFVCGGSIYLAFFLHQRSFPSHFVVALIVVAVVFNPIVSISLGRELWRIVDLLVAFGFFALGWMLYKRTLNRTDHIR